MLGSLVAGGMGVEEAHAIVGIDGAVLGEELDRIGYLGAAPLPGRVPHAFVELHVEQGPVLEIDGVTIGAVTEVQGIGWTEVTVLASPIMGTTCTSNPGGRRPAAFVRELADDLGAPGATVGRMDCTPTSSMWFLHRPRSPSICATPTMPSSWRRSSGPMRSSLQLQPTRAAPSRPGGSPGSIPLRSMTAWSARSNRLRLLMATR